MTPTARLARIAALASILAKAVAAVATLARDVDLEEAPGNDRVSVLECFQVSTPVLSAKGLVSGKDVVGPVDGSNKPITSCHETLMDYSFQSSYGHPFVGKHTP